MLKAMVRDSRGVGIAEYALLLFLVVAIAAGTYRFMGGRVRHAGNKTNQQFAQGAAGAGSGAQQGAGGGDNAGGTQSGGGNAAGGAGGAAGAGGGGGANQGGTGSKPADTSQASGAGDVDDAEAVQKTPLWKIIGAVFLVLFAVGGFFAFRKRKA
jgi:hypothetical protein